MEKPASAKIDNTSPKNAVRFARGVASIEPAACGRPGPPRRAVPTPLCGQNVPMPTRWCGPYTVIIGFACIPLRRVHRLRRLRPLSAVLTTNRDISTAPEAAQTFCSSRSIPEVTRGLLKHSDAHRRLENKSAPGRSRVAL